MNQLIIVLRTLIDWRSRTKEEHSAHEYASRMSRDTTVALVLADRAPQNRKSNCVHALMGDLKIMQAISLPVLG